MSTAIRMGHMQNVDQGAVGLIREYESIRAYAPHIIDALIKAGEKTYDVTPVSACSSADSLSQGVDKANRMNADTFISCHINSFSTPDARGCLVLYYPGSASGKKLAESIANEIAALGFYNRGAVSDDRGLYELKATNMTAVIVEPFFCSNAQDVELYNKIGAKGLGEAIAKGILKYKGTTVNIPEKTVLHKSTEPQKPAEALNGPFVSDLCGQGINMQMFEDHLEVRMGDKPWKVIYFDN